MSVFAFRDLPFEVKDEIFSKLDRDSMIAASNVCLSWRKVIHSLTSVSTSNCDADVKEKLEKCGWILGSHDVERCNCIELNLSLYKFIGDVPFACSELLPTRFSADYKGFLLSKHKVLVHSDIYGKGFSIFDLSQEKWEQIELFDKLRIVQTCHQVNMRGIWFDVVEKIISVGVQNQTLVIAMEEQFAASEAEMRRALMNKFGFNVDLDGFYDDYCSMTYEGFSRKKIVVWNHETLEFITELDINEEKVLEFAGEEYNGNDIIINCIGMAGNKLVVNLLVEDVECEDRFLIQIWKLDPEITSHENFSYLTTINHNLESGCVTGMFMNSNLLCLANRTHPEEKLILHVFHFDDLSLRSTTVLEDPQRESHHISIEEGSYKIAVLEMWNNKLNVFKFEAANEPICLKIDLNYLVKNPGSMFLANFLMGKIMLINQSGSQFQCIIVNEDGEVVEGNRQDFSLDDLEDVTFCDDGIVSVSSSTMRQQVNFYHTK